MANRIAPALVLRDGDRGRLEAMLRTPTLAAGLVQRARVVLLASDGMANYEIADRVGVSRPTVNLWRARYTERGLPGLAGQKPPGRPRSVDRSRVITATLTPPPSKLGVTHWSSRLLADQLGIEHSTVAGIWKEYGVSPGRPRRSSSPPTRSWRRRSSMWSGSIWRRRRTRLFSVDEKSQIQALNRTQKTLPMQPGHAEQRTHDYVRHGTTTLFAALEIATAKVTGLCKKQHRHQEFLAFLKHVARAYPDVELHLVMDNYGTHKHAKVKAWLEANPRIPSRYTGPESSCHSQFPCRQAPNGDNYASQICDNFADLHNSDATHTSDRVS